ncbi:hypothetical protein D3C72_1118740 [compost metagenome]
MVQGRGIRQSYSLILKQIYQRALWIKSLDVPFHLHADGQSQFNVVPFLQSGLKGTGPQLFEAAFRDRLVVGIGDINGMLGQHEMKLLMLPVGDDLAPILFDNHLSKGDSAWINLEIIGSHSRLRAGTEIQHRGSLSLFRRI